MQAGQGIPESRESHVLKFSFDCCVVSLKYGARESFAPFPMLRCGIWYCRGFFNTSRCGGGWPGRWNPYDGRNPLLLCPNVSVLVLEMFCAVRLSATSSCPLKHLLSYSHQRGVSCTLVHVHQREDVFGCFGWLVSPRSSA